MRRRTRKSTKRATPIVLALALAVGVLVSLPARATLTDRGNGLIYDDVLKITWLQDASLGGNRNWNDAVAWADALVFEGFDDWRLPSVSVAGGLPTGSTDFAFNCSTELTCRDNELGYMFYWSLGGNFTDDLTGNQGLILNIQGYHWSGTEFEPDTASIAWAFNFSSGDRGDAGKGNTYAAWAVRPGDVLAVPEPATWLLLAAGLAGLGLGRRRLAPRHR